MVRNAIRYGVAIAAAAVLLSSCGLRRHKYDNPITKDTQQPDKVLFDKAIDDIEHSRFERARLTLQTMMNTYDTSEYMAKAKLALADSWYREGGAHGFAQAEAEYKDFILFYHNMEEAAEAQMKICDMQYNQMEKADRDDMHARRAEEECKQVLLQFPNSKFAPSAKKRVLETQEVLANKENKVATFYYHKGSWGAAAGRFQALTDQYPNFSDADEGLWLLADAYRRMGDKFEDRQAQAYTKIVKDYPLSSHVEEASARLKAMNRTVPEASPEAYARMKYEQENRTSRGLLAKAWGPFSGRPDMSRAAKSGTPQMEAFKPMIPETVPLIARAPAAPTAEVSAQTVTPAENVLDKAPDARNNGAAGSTTPAGSAQPAAQQPTGPQPVVTRSGVDINTASEADLNRLPGVNKLTAKRIMALRPFSSINDLIRAGVSTKTIEKLKPAAAAPGTTQQPQPQTK